MYVLFLLMRVYPFWALPVALLLADLGRHHRRRNQQIQYAYWGIAGLLLFLVVLWGVFRGDLNSDRWVKSLFY